MASNAHEVALCHVMGSAATDWCVQFSPVTRRALTYGDRGERVDSDDEEGQSDQSLVSETPVFAAFHGGERGHCVTIWDRPVRHQCGLVGCRVGQASNQTL